MIGYVCHLRGGPHDGRSLKIPEDFDEISVVTEPKLHAIRNVHLSDLNRVPPVKVQTYKRTGPDIFEYVRTEEI